VIDVIAAAGGNYLEIAVVVCVGVAVFPTLLAATPALNPEPEHFYVLDVGASYSLSLCLKQMSWMPCVVYLLEKKRLRIEHSKKILELSSEM